jgi:hypothetical protein
MRIYFRTILLFILVINIFIIVINNILSIKSILIINTLRLKLFFIKQYFTALLIILELIKIIFIELFLI